MESEYIIVAARLFGALVAGGMIGLERSYHGRPAGFRTHTLVCVASSVLMLVALYQKEWFPGIPFETIRTDPTRMAQGIMTGIGFLGAGVIYKEGVNIHGLTTAASIWTTAAIGILVGVGFYFPAIVSMALVLGTLAGFRWIEARMPAQYFAYHWIRFNRSSTMPEEEVRALLAHHGFSVANMGYWITHGGSFFEYRMVLRTNDPANAASLAAALRGLEIVREFRISPTGD